MAEDELRYGLPVMEARQTLIGLSGPGGQGSFGDRVTRAEGLYRQIHAENPTSVPRMQEAQQALDQIAVMRRAYEQAARTQVVMRVQEVRMMLTEMLYMEGVCPDEKMLSQVLAQATFELKAGRVSQSSDGTASYTIVDVDSGIAVPVTCDRRSIHFDLSAAQR